MSLTLTADQLAERENLSDYLKSLKEAGFAFPNSSNAKKTNSIFYREIARGKSILIKDAYLYKYLKRNKIDLSGSIEPTAEQITISKKFLDEKLNLRTDEFAILEKDWNQYSNGMMIADMLFEFAANIGFAANQDYSCLLKRDNLGQIIVEATLNNISFMNEKDFEQKMYIPGEVVCRLTLKDGHIGLHSLSFSNTLLAQMLLSDELKTLSPQEIQDLAETEVLKKLAHLGEIEYQYLDVRKIKRMAVERNLEDQSALALLLYNILAFPLKPKYISALEEYVTTQKAALGTDLHIAIEDFIENARFAAEEFNTALDNLKELSALILTKEENKVVKRVIHACEELVGNSNRDVPLNMLTESLRKTDDCFRNIKDENPTAHSQAVKNYYKHIQKLVPKQHTKKLIGAMKCVAAVLLIAASAVAISTPFFSLAILGGSLAAVLLHSGIQDFEKANRLAKKGAALSKPVKETYRFFAKQNKKHKKTPADEDITYIDDAKKIDGLVDEKPTWFNDDSSTNKKSI